MRRRILPTANTMNQKDFCRSVSLHNKNFLSSTKSHSNYQTDIIKTYRTSENNTVQTERCKIHLPSLPHYEGKALSLNNCLNLKLLSCKFRKDKLEFMTFFFCSSSLQSIKRAKNIPSTSVCSNLIG